MYQDFNRIEKLKYIDSMGRQGHCDISYKDNIIICTERKDNMGMSITNAAEIIMFKVVNILGLNYSEFVWIEEYIYGINHTLDLVDYVIVDGEIKLSWTRINEDYLYNNLGVTRGGLRNEGDKSFR